MSLFKIIEMSEIFQISVLCLVVPVLFPYPNFDLSACRTRSRTILLKLNPYIFRTRTSYFQKLPYPYRYRYPFQKIFRIPSLHVPYLGCTKRRNAESVSVLRSMAGYQKPNQTAVQSVLCLSVQYSTRFARKKGVAYRLA